MVMMALAMNSLVHSWSMLLTPTFKKVVHRCYTETWYFSSFVLIISLLCWTSKHSTKSQKHQQSRNINYFCREHVISVKRVSLREMERERERGFLWYIQTDERWKMKEPSSRDAKCVSYYDNYSYFQSYGGIILWIKTRKRDEKNIKSFCKQSR